MLNSINFLIRHLLNFVIALTFLTVTVINTESILLVLLFMIGTIGIYYVSNKMILHFQVKKQAKLLGLTVAEYRLIERSLKVAKQQAQSLTQQYIRVRSVKSFKLLNEMSKLSRRIINIVQQNPQKFFTVEDFFYAHLPSAVELANNYAVLTKEQVTGTDIHLALEDTRKTLKGLHETMELDLKSALQSDIENLKIELDFAKLSNEKRKDQVNNGGE